MAPPSVDEEKLIATCTHAEKKCVKCGLEFKDDKKPVATTTADRRRRLSSGTFFGTFMKSIDETNKDQEIDEEENEASKDEISSADWSSPNRCSYLVKYSVNGVLKGQTRLSYDFNDRQELSRQTSLSRTNSNSSSVTACDVFGDEDENDGDDDRVNNYENEEEGEESNTENQKEEDIEDYSSKYDEDDEAISKSKDSDDLEFDEVNLLPHVEKKQRNFSITKQHSLDEYRMPARRTSSRMQKKLSMFASEKSMENTTTSANGLGSKQSSMDEESPKQQQQQPKQGLTFSALSDAKKKKIQQELLEGMFKYAEQKYGRKKPQRTDTSEEKRSPMEDYELYLRSLNIKVKSASDKLAVVLKQKRDIEAKLADAEKEHNYHKSKFTKAEEEKQNAVNESRDPILPKDFIPPQRVKGRGKAANLGALVMKASSQMEIWEDKFNAKRTKKNAATPEWMAKQKKSDKTNALLHVGRNKMKEKKPEANNNKFPATTLQKSDGNRTKPTKEDEHSNTTETKTEKVVANGSHDNKETKQEPVQQQPPSSEEEESESESEEEETSTFRRRKSRIPQSDDEDFDI